MPAKNSLDDIFGNVPAKPHRKDAPADSTSTPSPIEEVAPVDIPVSDSTPATAPVAVTPPESAAVPAPAAATPGVEDRLLQLVERLEGRIDQLESRLDVDNEDAMPALPPAQNVPDPVTIEVPISAAVPSPGLLPDVETTPEYDLMADELAVTPDTPGPVIEEVGQTEHDPLADELEIVAQRERDRVAQERAAAEIEAAEAWEQANVVADYTEQNPVIIEPPQPAHVPQQAFVPEPPQPVEVPQSVPTDPAYEYEAPVQQAPYQEPVPQQAPYQQPVQEAPYQEPVQEAPYQEPVPATPAYSEQPPVPAPADIASSEGGMVRRLDMAPADLLWTIGVEDAVAEAETQERSSLVQMRDEATAGKKGKKKRSQVRFDKLPLNVLQPGYPLILTVASPKGGVGKSTISVNLGVYIAAVAKAMAKEEQKKGNPHATAKRVLVFDGDIANGNLAVRVANKTEPNLLTLIDYIDEYGDPQHYDEAVEPQKAMRDFVLWNKAFSNLNVLVAPENPEAFDDLKVEDYRHILRLLGQYYDIIIIDSGTEYIMPSNRVWLAYAHQLYIPVDPDHATLYSASKYARLITYERTNYETGETIPPLVTPDRISTIMTKYDIDPDINPDFLLNKSFDWVPEDRRFRIPYLAKEALKAGNEGEFLVLQNEAYAKELGTLAKSVFHRYAAQRQQLQQQARTGV